MITTDETFWELYEAGKLEGLRIYAKKHREVLEGKGTWDCVDEMACFRYDGVCYIRFAYTSPGYVWIKRRGAKYIPGKFMHRSVIKHFTSPEHANRYFKACKGYIRER